MVEHAPQLPYVDEHTLEVAAPAAAVRRAVGGCLPRDAGTRVGAAILGTVPARAQGDPLTLGASIPGFAVVEADPDRRLVLAGRHRFSEYTLAFEIAEQGAVTQLTAISHARFPGIRGRAYRALVIGSGAHRVLVRRWVRRIRAVAEASG
jgi:hypothetical protein